MDLVIDHQQRDGWDVLGVTGEVDLATAPQLARAIGDVLGAEQRLCLDLSGVAFMDSTGLRELVKAHNTVDEVGGTLVIVPGGGPVAKLLAITGLEGKLALSESVDQALAR